MKPVNKMDTAELWQWLSDHPSYNLGIWSALPSALDIQPVHVNPLTNSIDIENPELNTKVRIWIEFGPMVYVRNPLTGDDDVIPSHDSSLDCGGVSFEDAFRNLCLIVLSKNGDYERDE